MAGGFGLLDRRLVLAQAGTGLRGAARVGEQRTDGGEYRADDGDLPGHAGGFALHRVPDLVVVRAVHMDPAAACGLYSMRW